MRWRTTAAALIALEAEARALGLGAGRAVSSVLAGTRASRFRSRGADYLESRPYHPGDDVRQLDWRVTARSGKLHTKLYVEERERPVLLLVDLSPCMYFGSGERLKVELAAEAAVLLAWAVVRHGDRVGALLSAQHDHLELPPAGGRRGVMQLIRALCDRVPACGNALMGAGEPSSATAAAGDDTGNQFHAALERLQRVARPGTLVLLLSDFMALDEGATERLRRLGRHQELQALWISDALERQAPAGLRGRIGDGQHSGWVDLRQATARQAWSGAWRAHANTVEARLRAAQVPWLALDTATGARENLAPHVATLGKAARGGHRAAGAARC